MTTPIEGLQRLRDGSAVEIREAQAVAVRMVEARNALRAKVLQARATSRLHPPTTARPDWRRGPGSPGRGTSTRWFARARRKRSITSPL